MKSTKLFLLFLLMAIIGISCGSAPFNRKFHKVTRIVNGNTLEVHSGIYIQLIGIENTKASKSFLEENVLGHRIRIKYDRKNSRVKARRGNTLYAYVVTDKRISINGLILQKKLSAINTNSLSDSLKIFKLYANGLIDKSNKPSTKEISRQKNNKIDRDNPNTTLTEIVNEIKPSVFLIISADEKDNPIAQGTGFFIDKKGVGISNHHVFEGGSNYYIKTLDGGIYKVTNIYVDNSEYDYIIFQVDNSDGYFKQIDIKYGPLMQGEPIFVLGNPKGLESTLTTGIISSIRSEISTNDIIQFDAAVSHGSSGSPLCNMQGEAIGVVVSKITDCENCNFAININIIKQKLDHLQY